MRSAPYFVLGLVGCAATVNANIVEWPASAGGNGHFYEAVLVGPFTTWHQASSLAIQSGGHLATISSAEENAFVYALAAARPELWTASAINNGLGPWIGGLQSPEGAEPDGGWGWVTGEPFTYVNWVPGTPPEGGSPNEGEGGLSDYMHFFGVNSSTGPYWNDAAEGVWDIRGYVVEYVPAPGSAVLLSGAAMWSGRRRRRRLDR